MTTPKHARIFTNGPTDIIIGAPVSRTRPIPVEASRGGRFNLPLVWLVEADGSDAPICRRDPLTVNAVGVYVRANTGEMVYGYADSALEGRGQVRIVPQRPQPLADDTGNDNEFYDWDDEA